MRKILSVTLALAVAVAIVGAQDKGKGGGKGGAKGGFTLPPMIQINIAGVSNGMFPAANAGQGPSPAISWTQVPAGTQSFVLLMHDPDPVLNKKASTDVTHWLVFDIPGTATGLPAGLPSGPLPDGTKQSSMRGPAYMGPGPPAGHGPHHYTFELWALDTKLNLPASASREDVVKAMDDHVIGKGYTVALFENK